jgi:diacylglycerol kinase
MALKSKFQNAFRGLGYFFRHEKNVQIHFIIAIVVILAGFFLGISITEWLAVLLCIGGVITAEGINSAIERLSDMYSKEQNKNIKIIKDLSAGAVLFMAIVSLVIGMIVFLPYLLKIIL